LRARGFFANHHAKRILPREMGYWSIVGPVWDAIDIYSGPDVFRQTFNSAPRASALLFAAHFCQSEICNGGFHQFFWNSTGVLAPEAVEGFGEIGQAQVAALLEKGMSLLWNAYPRDRNERQERLEQIPKSSLDALDNVFYSLIDSEAGGFTAAADRYEAMVRPNSDSQPRASSDASGSSGSNASREPLSRL